MVNVLQHGRECSNAARGADAYQALLCADQAAALQADDLERLATAAYLTGRDLEFQRILERLHRVHVEAETRRAPRAAHSGSRSPSCFAARSVSRTPGSREAQRLVEDRDCVERGYLLLPVAEQQLRDGQVDAAHATADQAVAIGESFGDADLTAAARHLQGRALIQQGDVLAGLKRLDETMLAVVAGELSPIMTGLMYCSVIDACRQVYALGRAREWTSAFSSVCEQQPEMVAFTGTCLVHRAEILQLQGAWPDALTEACRACERAQRADRKPPGAALYQQAEIHRLRGEFAKAEEAYRSASELGCEPQPGLALLRLAQGRTDAACAAIRRLTSATSDRLRRARLLPAHLEIMLAHRRCRGGAHAPAMSCESWRRRSTPMCCVRWWRRRTVRSPSPKATRSGARPAAVRVRAVGAPRGAYEAARVRVLIGRACRALGDEEAAGLEHQAARSVFERLGARPDLARLDAPSHVGRTAPRSIRSRLASSRCCA